ncbi:MAG TPA: HD domain-containing protein [Phycisphaerales bacterium]|nr:HD domain-containing protein [Phycisphaerales bacterium]
MMPFSADGLPVGRISGAEPAFFQEAVNFAARAHRHQLRKDGRTPYVAHVIRVAMTVSWVFGCDDKVAILAALLHDTIEDTTTDYDDIAERFGVAVADCVAALTKNMAMSEEPREIEYDARIAKGTWQARLVKLADVYENLCDVGDLPEAKQAETRRKAVDKAHRALVLAAAERASNPAIGRACDALEHLLKHVHSHG